MLLHYMKKTCQGSCSLRMACPDGNTFPNVIELEFYFWNFYLILSNTLDSLEGKHSCVVISCHRE